MYLCTKEAPWNSDIRGPVQHEGAREVGDQVDGYPDGDIMKMECRDCGAKWKVELPQ